LTLKENKFLNFFYYIQIVEIPTKKGANSYKLKIGNSNVTVKTVSRTYFELKVKKKGSVCFICFFVRYKLGLSRS